MKQRLAMVIAASIATLPIGAHAELFKCKETSGATTYRDTPCAQAERREPADLATPAGAARGAAAPKNGALVLWESTSLIRPRASHGGAGKALTPQELQAVGDYKYMLGAPLKIQECRANSLIEMRLANWGTRCESQIRAGGGTCEVTQPASTMSDPRASVTVITGNYRTELHVVSRITQGKDAQGRPVIDETENHIRSVGPCPAGIKVNEQFVVNDDGTLRPMR